MPTSMKKITPTLLLCAALLSGASVSALATPMPGVDYAGIVENNKASVVFIDVTQKPTAEKADADEAKGQGSGFIYDAKSGLVLTNAHVVKDAIEVTVTLADKRRFKAKVIGADERTDVAVVQISAEGLKAVQIGQPSQLKVGAPVAAVGAPFGLEMTVTAGIVSAKHRTLGAQFVPFIQTDAAVNPGNSGGPLFNADGEVVGINSQIYSKSGNFAGLSFAIPIDIAVDVAHSLVKNGHVIRSKIGLLLQPVNADLSDAFGLPREAGAIVTMVDEKGPGLLAGFQIGDIILKADEVSVEDSIDLPRYVTSVAPGSTVRLEVWRNHKLITLHSKVTEMTEEVVPEVKENTDTAEYRLGLAVRALDKSELDKLKLPSGLVVTAVREKTPAAKAGFKAGDMLLSFGDKPIRELTDLRAGLKSKSKEVPLLVQNPSGRMFVLVPSDTEPPKVK